MLNVAAIQGRFTQEPELKTTSSGVPVLSFCLAVERQYVKSGEERQADFIDCVAWKNIAEFISKYFSKGSMIVLEGSIQTRNFEDKNGNKRKAVEFLVNKACFCGREDKQSNAEVEYEDEFDLPI
jgi:single-strand DNA-binding protein